MQKVFKQTSFPVNYLKLHRSLDEGKEINGNIKWSMWQLLQVLKFSFPHSLEYFTSLGTPPHHIFGERKGAWKERGNGEESVFLLVYVTFTLRVPHSKVNGTSKSLLPQRWSETINHEFWCLTPYTFTNLKKDLQANYFNPMTRNVLFANSWLKILHCVPGFNWSEKASASTPLIRTSMDSGVSAVIADFSSSSRKPFAKIIAKA